MIDRDEVLHVAALARLRLSEAEVSAMTVELAGVLDHVTAISALDLGGVEPTAHVAREGGALRADEPRESLARATALASAPAVSDDGFLVPSPQA
ncbi:MAG: Asp-tRNA(Asn)/Glu-tRNA(Gln) amidotransferase subunit GatC [Acidobacteriota bacterium]|nr:Asp-tRNA(Asn)/Glu-tRNA(Gln) amidotransferase subunit GatC [Acidobacteriota bacterium]